MASKSVAEVSRELNVSCTTLYKWGRLLKEEGTEGLSNKKKMQSDQEISRLNKLVQEYKLIVAEKDLQVKILKELLKKSPSLKKIE